MTIPPNPDRCPVTIDDILRPKEPAEFFADSWHRKFQLMGGPEDRFSDLFGWDDLNHIVKYHHILPPRARVVQKGRSLAPEAFTETRSKKGGRETHQRISPPKLAELLRRGATFIVNAVSDMHPRLKALVVNMERALHTKVNMNLYAGWRTDNGFDQHWDDHDFFILQVAGRKKWEVYEDTRPQPLEAEAKMRRRPTNPLWSGMLTPGDVLYVPRGWWHIAHPADEPCLHLTTGVSTVTGHDFMGWLRERALRAHAFRKDLPLVEGRDALAAHLRTLREALNELWTDELVDEFMLWREMTADHGRDPGFPEVAMRDPLPAPPAELRSAVDRPVGVREITAAGVVEITMMGRTWRYPGKAAKMVRVLAAGGTGTVEELAGHCDTGMPDEKRRDVLRRMVTDGTAVKVTEGPVTATATATLSRS